MPGLSFDDVREGGGIERALGADVNRASTGAAHPVYEIGSGIDGARCADDDHQRAVIDFALNAIHIERCLAKEDNVGAEPCAALATRDLVEAAVDGAIVDGRS